MLLQVGIVFFEGLLLFRDGELALHEDCCCPAGTATATATGSPEGTACGECEFQWEELTQEWRLVEDRCVAGCVCVEPTEPGVSEGEIRITECVEGS